jgi:glycosyltransferase involved in cell wall biosynthesis
MRLIENGLSIMPENASRKILFLINNLRGGTGKHFISMIGNWDSHRWKKEIFCQTLISENVPKDVAIIQGNQPRYNHYPITQTSQLIQLKRYLANCQPCLIHAYFFWPIIYGRILKRFGKVKVLVENREDQGFNWGRHEYILLRLTRSIPDRVICVSEAVQQVVLERERLDPKKVMVIHNGIQMPNENLADKQSVRKELGFDENHLIVGMVANMDRPVKGVRYFLDAIPIIKGVIPIARFVIFGRGEEETSLRKKARTLGIDQHLIFAGHRENMDKYYPIMDISVLTSLSEGLSITVLESMSHGLPVVVTRVGGNPEVVVDGETGYLVPPKDSQAFAKGVIELLRDPLRRVRMGEKGRQRIQECFDLKKVASRYLQVYEELLQSKNN